MINKKKEGGFYASKVRLFLNEYDGMTTAKDQLVNLVAHKWQPQMAPAIY